MTYGYWDEVSGKVARRADRRVRWATSAIRAWVWLLMVVLGVALLGASAYAVAELAHHAARAGGGA